MNYYERGFLHLINGLHVFPNEFSGYGTSPDSVLELPSMARLDQQFQPLNNGLTGLWFSLQSSNLLASADVRMELLDVKTGTMLATGNKRLVTVSLRGLDGFRVGDDFVHFGFPPIKDSRQKPLRLVVYVRMKWYGSAAVAGIRTPGPDESKLFVNGAPANAVLFSVSEYGAATAVVLDANGAELARSRQLTPSNWWSKYFKFDKAITGAASIEFVDDTGDAMRWEARQDPGIIVFGRGRGSYRPALAKAELH